MLTSVICKNCTKLSGKDCFESMIWIIIILLLKRGEILTNLLRILHLVLLLHVVG